MKTDKKYEIKPLKGQEKYRDDLLEALIVKRLKDKEVNKESLQPFKSYRRLIKC